METMSNFFLSKDFKPLFEKQTGKKTKRKSLEMAYFLKTHNSRGRARQKLGSRTSIQVFHRSVRKPITEQLALPPRSTEAIWSGGKEAELSSVASGNFNLQAKCPFSICI